MTMARVLRSLGVYRHLRTETVKDRLLTVAERVRVRERFRRRPTRRPPTRRAGVETGNIIAGDMKPRGMHEQWRCGRAVHWAGQGGWRDENTKRPQDGDGRGAEEWEQVVALLISGSVCESMKASMEANDRSHCQQNRNNLTGSVCYPQRKGPQNQIVDTHQSAKSSSLTE